MVFAMGFAFAVHVAAFATFVDLPPQRIEVRGGRIEVQFGAGGANTADARADRGAMQETPEATPKPSRKTSPDRPEANQVSSLTKNPVKRTEEPSPPGRDTAPEPERETRKPERVKSPTPERQDEPQTDGRVRRPRASEDEGVSPDAVSDDGAARADSVASPTPGAADGETAADTTERDAGNSEAENYAGKVIRHLSRVRRPRAPSAGSARITFTIAADGMIEAIEVTESSGSGRFDREAIKMVERGEPFPEPPPGVNRTFTIEIEGR